MSKNKSILYGLIGVVSVVTIVGLVVLLTRSGGGPASGGASLDSTVTSMESTTEQEKSSSNAMSSLAQDSSQTTGDSSTESKKSSSVGGKTSSKSSDHKSSAITKPVDGAVASVPYTAPSSSDGMPAGGYTREELAAELNDWNLFLVNPDHTIDENWAPADLKSLGNDQSIDSRAYSAYNAMVKAAKKDGVSLWAVSGYRSYSKQNRLYNNRVTRSKNENPSFTQAQAEADAAQHVARPGTSEHQIGLAVDFNSVETSFASTKAGKWLKQNAAQYGFILRYEKEKQSLTKVTYEPWHYRYVGAKHALTMQEKGMCMEEYIQWLKGN